jgi:hypothetical protein
MRVPAVFALLAFLPACADRDDDGFPHRHDCNDDDASVNPGAVDVCGDGIDNDCDGAPPICSLDGDWSDIDDANWAFYPALQPSSGPFVVQATARHMAVSVVSGRTELEVDVFELPLRPGTGVPDVTLSATGIMPFGVSSGSLVDADGDAGDDFVRDEVDDARLCSILVTPWDALEEPTARIRASGPDRQLGFSVSASDGTATDLIVGEYEGAQWPWASPLSGAAVYVFDAPIRGELELAGANARIAAPADHGIWVTAEGRVDLQGDGNASLIVRGDDWGRLAIFADEPVGTVGWADADGFLTVAGAHYANAVGDLDGDGRDELFIYTAAFDFRAVREMPAGDVTGDDLEHLFCGIDSGSACTEAGPADYDGDGQADLAVVADQGSPTGDPEHQLWLIDGPDAVGDLSQPVDVRISSTGSAFTPLTGRLDADGAMDLAFVRFALDEAEPTGDSIQAFLTTNP